jgi:hypothetical protein
VANVIGGAFAAAVLAIMAGADIPPLAGLGGGA